MSASISTVLAHLSVSKPAAILEIPKKTAIIRLRWPVVLLGSYLLLYSGDGRLDPVIAHGFLLFYLLSNAGLYWVDEKLFSSSHFYAPLVVFDLVFLTVAVSVSGKIGADFYLAYLLTILLCGICKDFRGWIIVTLLSPIVYGSFLLQSPERLDPVLYLRIPFPFVVALFYGYFVQLENSERTVKEQAEREAQGREAQEQIRHLFEQTLRQTLELEKSNRVKDQFLSTMSHVFRTPLNVIMGYADMIKDRILGPISEEQERSLEKIMVRSRDLLDMISGILQATSLEAGAVAAENRPVSLTELLGELRSDYEAPLAKEVVLVWDYPEDLPVIRTDKDKLKQILAQFIHNAVKFTPQGQVTISARQVPGEGKVEFKVTDTGIGIPQDALLLIFEKFRQVDSSQTRTNGGIGLGLYIAKRLADLLGGTIHVESEPGKGSVFTLTLPY